jgi:NitT/TauT family transport system substrate-binding protein
MENNQINNGATLLLTPVLNTNIMSKPANESAILNGENPLADTGLTKPAEEAPAPPPPTHNNNYRRIILGLCGLIIIVAAVGGGLLWYHKAYAKPATLTPITVQLSWVNNPEYAGMYVAEAKGYYKAAGLNVDLKDYTDGTNVNPEVADGQVDYGIGTPLEIILARSQGENIKAIAAIYQTSAFAFVIQKGAGISTPADFKGKVLGDSAGDNEALVTYKVLAANAGLNVNDLNIQPVNGDIVTAFQDNQAPIADIYRTDQTFLLNQAHIPYTELFPEEYGFAIYGDVLIASDYRIAHYPAQTAAFVAATLKGWEYAISHQTETLALLAKVDDPSYQIPGYAKYDLSGTAQLVQPTGDQPFGSMSYAVWNRAYQGVEASGLLQKQFNVNNVFTTQFIPAQ